MQFGKTQTLQINRSMPQGLYLTDSNNNEVLLPHKYAPDTYEIGDEIEVFVYHDNDGRPIATTKKPFAEVGQFAALEAVSVNNLGAFFNNGIDKDLFVPFSQQTEKIDEGDFYVVRVYLDLKSGRIAGSTRILNFLEKDVINLKVGQQVDLIPFEETEIGILVIINEMYQGMLYKNEIFEEIQVGDKVTGYVKKIRTDNKVDVSLNKFGYRAVDDNIKKLHKVLTEHNGYLRLTDKSSPEEIYELLGMSKKVFKKAVGGLFKAEQIEIRSTGIKLITKKLKSDS